MGGRGAPGGAGITGPLVGPGGHHRVSRRIARGLHLAHREAPAGLGAGSGHARGLPPCALLPRLPKGLALPLAVSQHGAPPCPRGARSPREEPAGRRAARRRRRPRVSGQGDGSTSSAWGISNGVSVVTPLTGLTFEEISTDEEFAALGDSWNALVRAMPRPSPHLLHQWLLTWWRHYGVGNELAVHVAYRGHELVGALPLCVR